MYRDLPRGLYRELRRFYTAAEIVSLFYGLRGEPWCEAVEVAVDAINERAPAGYEYIVDGSSGRWEFNEAIVKEDLRNGRELGEII